MWHWGLKVLAWGWDFGEQVGQEGVPTSTQEKNRQVPVNYTYGIVDGTVLTLNVSQDLLQGPHWHTRNYLTGLTGFMCGRAFWCVHLGFYKN